MGRQDIKYLRWVEIIRLKNRIVKMPDNRLPKIVWNWDRATKTGAWLEDIEYILHYTGLTDETKLDDITDLEIVNNVLYQMVKNAWRLETYSKPKLRTFHLIHDFEQHRPMEVML